MNRRLTAMADNNASTSKLAISVNPRDRPLMLRIIVNLRKRASLSCIRLLVVPILERQAAGAYGGGQNRTSGLVAVRVDGLSHHLNVHFINLAGGERGHQRVGDTRAARPIGPVTQVIRDFEIDNV